jgi:hypothetical protein
MLARGLYDQLAGQPDTALRCIPDFLDSRTGYFRRFLPPQQKLGVPQNRGEQIVQLMGEFSGKLPCAFRIAGWKRWGSRLWQWNPRSLFQAAAAVCMGRARRYFRVCRGARRFENN